MLIKTLTNAIIGITTGLLPILIQLIAPSIDIPANLKPFLWLICLFIGLAFIYKAFENARKGIIQKPKLVLKAIENNKPSNKVRLYFPEPPTLDEGRIEDEIKNKEQELLVNQKAGIDTIEARVRSGAYPEFTTKEYIDMIHKNWVGINLYIKLYHQYLKNISRINRVHLCLFNNGKKPAENVKISIDYPQEFNILKNTQLYQQPEINYFSIEGSPLKNTYKKLLIYKEGKETKFEDHIKKIKKRNFDEDHLLLWEERSGKIKSYIRNFQHYNKYILELFIEIKANLKKAKYFKFDYKMIADNIDKEVKGSIPIKIENII